MKQECTYEELAGQDEVLIHNVELLNKLFSVTFQKGDKLKLSWFDGEEHTTELAIAGFISQSLPSDSDGSFYITDRTMKKLWKDMNTATDFRVTIEDYVQNGDQAEREIRAIVDEFSDLRLSTLRERKLGDSAIFNKLNLQFYGICIFIILFNLVNTIISSITV